MTELENIPAGLWEPLPRQRGRKRETSRNSKAVSPRARRYICRVSRGVRERVSGTRIVAVSPGRAVGHT